MADSMRIRFDNAPYREDVIERVADYYDCNRTDAVIKACDDVHRLTEVLEWILQREDLTQQQKQEIAERASRCRGVSFNISEKITIERE
jgi:hypothetical protein